MKRNNNTICNPSSVFFLILLLLFYYAHCNVRNGSVTLNEASYDDATESDKNIEHVIIFDPNRNTYNLPFRYRTTRYPLKSEKSLSLPKSVSYDLAKLQSETNGIPISGGAQFSEEMLRYMKEKETPHLRYVVDLRQESHGFVNGVPVTWFSLRNWGNFGKPNDQCHEDEKHRLQGVREYQSYNISLVVTETQDGKLKVENEEDVKISSVLSEEELSNKLGLKYLRLYVTDHLAPVPEEVDRFLRFVKEMIATAEQEQYDKNQVIMYVHCRGGMGRTTSFMVMYEMLFNAEELSFEDFIVRHALLGGRSLFHAGNEKGEDLVPPSNHASYEEVMERLKASDYKVFYAEQRLNFLKEFYEFCKQGSPLERSFASFKQSKMK